MTQEIEKYLPPWYCKFRSVLRVASFVLLIPVAAVILEVAAAKMGIYSSPHPWPLWFKGLALLFGIPSAALFETIGKLDKMASVMRGLAHPDPKIRQESALCLRESRSYSKYAVPALVEGITDSDDDVVTAVVETLQHLTGQKLGKNQMEWKQWLQQNKGKGAS